MGQYSHTAAPQRGMVTIDWMLASVGGIALLLFVGSMIRTNLETDPTRDVGGFRILADGDELLAFQDFSFGAAGWNLSETTTDLPGLGPVLGPNGAAPVNRSFSVPDGTDNVHLSFDLHLIGDWAGDIHIALDQVDVLALTRPDPAGDVPGLTASRVGGHLAAAQPVEVTPTTADGTPPGSADGFTTYSVLLHVADPGDGFMLRFWTEASVGPEASWALDNVTAIGIADQAVDRDQVAR